MFAVGKSSNFIWIALDALHNIDKNMGIKVVKKFLEHRPDINYRMEDVVLETGNISQGSSNEDQE